MSNSSSVSLVVGSTIQDPGYPEQVTDSIGADPSEIDWSELQSRDSNSGQFVTHKTWLWVLHSPLDASHPPFQRLRALLEILLPLKDGIGRIPEKYWKHVRCDYDSTPIDFPMISDWGLVMSHEDVVLLADLGLGLSCNTRVWTPEAYKANLTEPNKTQHHKSDRAGGSEA